MNLFFILIHQIDERTSNQIILGHSASTSFIIKSDKIKGVGFIDTLMSLVRNLTFEKKVLKGNDHKIKGVKIITT